MIDYIRSAWQAPEARRTAFLFAAMILNVALGYVVTKLNTAWLSVEAYGMYSLFLNTVMLSRVLFSFGVFESATRRIAIEATEDIRREWLGITTIVTLFLGILLALFTGVLSLFFDQIFETKIAFLLALFWPLVFALLPQIMLQTILRGFGHIRRLGLLTFAPRLLYVAVLIVLIFYGRFTLRTSLFSFLITVLIMDILFLVQSRPRFHNFKERLSLLLREIREYGIHLYTANIMTAFFYHSDKLIIAYFLEARQLAYYALAFALTAPIPYFSNALSTALYKRFANENALQKRFLVINALVVWTITGSLILLRKMIIVDLFSAKFLPSLEVFILLAIAFAFNGLSVPYTMFFKAQKEGVDVRNITLGVQIVFFILNIILIPLWGINGAAIAALTAFAIDYAAYVYRYRKLFITR